MARADEPFDAVQKPKHYNVHPSGIECYDFAKYFSFALGNAVKYLWRVGQKQSEPAIMELGKAMWYVRAAQRESGELHPPAWSREATCMELLERIVPHHNPDVASALRCICCAQFCHGDEARRLLLQCALATMESEMARQQEPIVRELEGNLDGKLPLSGE